MLARANGEPTGRQPVESRFDSCRQHDFEVMPNGKVLGLDPRRSRFDSCHLDCIRRAPGAGETPNLSFVSSTLTRRAKCWYDGMQTCRSQKPVSERTWEFESPYQH